MKKQSWAMDAVAVVSDDFISFAVVLEFSFLFSILGKAFSESTS